MTKIVLTKWSSFSKQKDGRIYIDKERILEVHEDTGSGGCTLVIKHAKENEYYSVCESFDDIKALMEYDPAVADIVMKGNEL